MPKLIFSLVWMTAAALFATAANADFRATVPQITAEDGAFVVQVPSGRRQIIPINRGTETQSRADTAQAPRRDFILDFGGQNAKFSLPSVREGVRISFN